MSGGSKPKKPSDNEHTRNLAYVAAEKWNFAQEKLKPLQEKYMEHVGSINSDSNRSFVRGRANDGMQDALGATTGAVRERSAQAGLDMGSGGVSGSNTDAAIAAATRGGETAARAEFELGGDEITGMQNIINMGNEQETSALRGMSRMAQIASGDARREVVADFNRRSANLQTLGSVAGMGASYAMNGGFGGGGEQQQMMTSEGNQLGWSYDDYGMANPNLPVGVS